MNRRDSVLTLLALGAAPLTSLAQQAAKAWRIAYLGFGSPEANGYVVDALKLALRGLGYVESKNVVFEVRWAMGNADRLPDLAKELVLLRPDVMIGPGISQAHALQQASATIPIVIAGVSDPVGTSLVKSLPHPGGNITGLSTLSVDYSPKLLELLRTVVPKLSRVSILVGRDTGRAQLINLQTAAREVDIDAQVIEVHTQAEIENSFARMIKNRVGAVIVLPSALFTFQRPKIVELLTKHRVPSVFTTREFPEVGGLMSYGSDLVEQLRNAATFVDKILKGAKPADLPIEQPTTFDLVINMKTAKALGVNIPPELLLRADKVIE